VSILIVGVMCLHVLIQEEDNIYCINGRGCLFILVVNMFTTL
jgi:hypothetical protein